MSRSSAKQKVDRGVALLDQRSPGWVSKVGREGLESGPRRRNRSDYEDFRARLYRCFGVVVTREEARDHGFACRTPFGYPRTERAWQEAISARQALGPVEATETVVCPADAHELAVDELELYLRRLDLTV